MTRKVQIEEIRRFFETANRQFEEAGISLHNVRFKRDEEGCLAQISLNYTENGINIHEKDENPK